MRCEQGYLCEVCGLEVAELTESDLYLRYILGEVPAEHLHAVAEKHIRCNPTLAQFIVDEQFPAVLLAGPFAKCNLDADYVRAEEARITNAWQHLQKLPASGLSLIEYPLVHGVEPSQAITSPDS